MDQETVASTGVPELPTAGLRDDKQIKQLSAEEKRAYARKRKQKSRAKQAASASVVARKYFSSTEIKKEQALEILEKERGIRNPRVLEVCWILALIAARALSLPVNVHLFTHGVQATLEAVATKNKELPVPQIEQIWNPGERIRLHELFALFDYSTSFREPKYTFEQFREMRRVCITDVFRFGNEILGMDLHDQPHGRWSRELFVQKNPDLLPEIYDWEDVKNAIAGQFESSDGQSIRQRLLMSSRSSYKSSYNLIDLLSWVLVFGGDIRILMVSATQPLSRGFLKKFKSYWTVKNPNAPTLFQQLFPEFMLHSGETGQEKSFVSPMRRLDLIQPTLFSSSLESEGLAGERCDLLVFEDVAEISNSSTPEMREKTLLKFDMLRELLEPFGGLQVVGTPFAPGDIYSVMLEREEQRDEKKLLVQINPCWWVKPGVIKLPYDQTLTEDEVILMFPERLKFRELKDKLRENTNVFRQQSLCMWVPDEEEGLRVHFDEDLLKAHVRPVGYFNPLPRILRVLAVDVAFSVSRYADFSAITTLDFLKDTSTDRNIVVVQDLVMDRFRPSDLGLQVVLAIQKHRPDRVLIERVGAWESLQSEIQKHAAVRSVALPFIYWKPTTIGGTNLKSKAARIKAIEPLLARDQFWLTNAPGWTDSLIQQFVRFDGVTKSNSSRKDDGPDACALAIEMAMPRQEGETKSDDQTKYEEEARERALLQMQYDSYFVNGGQQRPNPQFNPSPQSSPGNPVTSTLQRFGFVKKVA